MTQTLEYIVKRFGVDLSQPSPHILNNYSRYQIPEMFNKLGFTIGAEIGTEVGRYAEMLFKKMPNLQLTSVDLWDATLHQENASQEKMDNWYQETLIKLKPYHSNILKMSSMDAVKQFPDNSLDFVFIDANHDFEFVVNDIIFWSKKVKIGGIVYGHDYSDEFAVKEAVNAFVKVNKVDPWFVLRANYRNVIDSWLFVRDEKDLINKYK